MNRNAWKGSRHDAAAGPGLPTDARRQVGSLYEPSQAVIVRCVNFFCGHRSGLCWEATRRGIAGGNSLRLAGVGKMAGLIVCVGSCPIAEDFPMP